MDAVAARAQTWVDRRRTEAVPMDLAVSFYERDRELFASVLGAAIALRLFLFMVPLIVVVSTLVVLVLGTAGVGSLLDEASVTGQMADSVVQTLNNPNSVLLAVMVTNLWLSAWAGRNLAIVLAVCSGAAWRLEVRARRVTLRAQSTITLLVFALVLIASISNRIRDEFGLAGATTSWVLGATAFSLAWFAVLWALPKGTPDPGALLPGAALVGASLTVLQWFMQFYLPSRLERSSATAGAMGSAVAVLGAMFIIGRVMASSFVLNAVVYERLGSVSGLVFGLPLVRRLPGRYPRLARWFDLPAVAARVTESSDVGGAMRGSARDSDAAQPPPRVGPRALEPPGDHP